MNLTIIQSFHLTRGRIVGLVGLMGLVPVFQQLRNKLRHLPLEMRPLDGNERRVTEKSSFTSFKTQPQSEARQL